ncbi:hypothetical protein HNQ60_002102 [Povalibacter uvarum]|uniref:Uncharacterized protein n=1 Tax=Povalibacter uvarum TaxID=732238 RepID=A0A841HKW8_9GAMM|nr:hypothetical protein [Povalibacter uvarum]MBB6093224.1 hypothetical protein [Povalibacter uvarum]
MSPRVLLLRSFLLTLCLLGASAPSLGQGLEEVVVTGSLSEGGSMPGTFLRKTGDFLLLQVNIRNDTREAPARKEEIYATLRNALANASRDGSIELSVIDENDLVIPLKVDSATVVLRPGDRPDTNTTLISVKTRIPATGANGQALISKLKDFTAGIKIVGRTTLDPDGSVDISIVSPNRYRDEIIALFAADAKKVAAALGEDYRIVTTGIDRPVRWVRVGLLELGLFVPYSYQVVPSSIQSIAIHAEE